MKNFNNHIENLIKLEYSISVDVDSLTVFAEAENDNYHVLLETSDIYGDWDITILINGQENTNIDITTNISNFIMKMVSFELNNDSDPFTYEDKLHATNLIYS